MLYELLRDSNYHVCIRNPCRIQRQNFILSFPVQSLKNTPQMESAEEAGNALSELMRM